MIVFNGYEVLMMVLVGVARLWGIDGGAFWCGKAARVVLRCPISRDLILAVEILMLMFPLIELVDIQEF